ELTKEHEEVVRDTLGTLSARYESARPLGEVTLVVAGATTGDAEAGEDWDDDAIAEQAAALVAGGVSARDAARELAALTGRARRDVYRIVVAATGAERQDDDDDPTQ